MKIKVCGMKDLAQIQQLEAMGADFCGLIFYPGSKRYISDKDEKFVHDIKNTSIRKVGVFVNATTEEVIRKVAEFNLFAVQLHGDESPEYCRAIHGKAKLIKVFRMPLGDDVDQYLAPFMDVADYFLFDNGNGNYGGTGEKFNWELLLHAKIGKPFFLSGGIGPGDIDTIMNFYHPFLLALDINSRFETSPGLKNPEQVKQFINTVKEKTQ